MGVQICHPANSDTATRLKKIHPGDTEDIGTRICAEIPTECDRVVSQAGPCPDGQKKQTDSLANKR